MDEQQDAHGKIVPKVQKTNPSVAALGEKGNKAATSTAGIALGIKAILPSFKRTVNFTNHHPHALQQDDHIHRELQAQIDDIDIPGFAFRH